MKIIEFRLNNEKVDFMFGDKYIDERKFKIRQDMIIIPDTDKGKTFYCVTNLLSNKTVRLDSKAYIILRHFKNRNILEVQKHLKERHGLNLTLTALKSYLDLFLDLYLFADCLDLYIGRDWIK